MLRDRWHQKWRYGHEQGCSGQGHERAFGKASDGLLKIILSSARRITTKGARGLFLQRLTHVSSSTRRNHEAEGWRRPAARMAWSGRFCAHHQLDEAFGFHQYRRSSIDGHSRHGRASLSSNFKNGWP